MPAGAEFEFEIVYNVESDDPSILEGDLMNLLAAMSLLEDDYLGGHGSRGCGAMRWRPQTLVGRTLTYYSAVSASDRETAEIALQVDSLDACRESIPDLVLGMLAAAETPQPEPDAEPAPGDDGSAGEPAASGEALPNGEE